MKKRLILASTLIALALAPITRAQEPKAAPAHKSDEPETELGGKMEKLNGAYRKLKRQIADPSKNAESLVLVATVKEQAEASLALKPAITTEKPTEEQAKFVESYKTEMKKMIDLVAKLEVALKAGKNEEAAKMIADLDAQQKASHKQFKKQKQKQ